MPTLFDFVVVYTREPVAFCCVPRILVFTVLSISFPYFTDVVQLLCSLSGWLHLNCSSIGTVFNAAETNCKAASNLCILLMNSNCFTIYFQQHSSYVCWDINSTGLMSLSSKRPLFYLRMTVALLKRPVPLQEDNFSIHKRTMAKRGRGGGRGEQLQP